MVSEGRVEVFRRGAWRPVCGSGWHVKDANVVCRELGFGRALTAPKTASKRLSDFRSKVQTIWLTKVQCVGNEDSINECGHSGWKKYCTGDNDAGVVCSRGNTPCYS